MKIAKETFENNKYYKTKHKKIMLPLWYGKYKDFIDNSINSYLNKYLEKNIDNPGLERFKDAILYSVLGGKKLRAILALEFYIILSGKAFSKIKETDDIIKFCIALELIHAYSLVHDDLPCMDNDELRRGQPTVWKKYSEYEAVLVGDLLNTISFEILSEIKDTTLAVKLIKLVSNSIGFYGMIGGQIDDMYFEKNADKLNLDYLLGLHSKKTGALIKASILGGVMISQKVTTLEKFKNLGEKIGLAFQVKDDLLDVEGTQQETGKSIGGEKKGFVYFKGIEQTKIKLKNLIKDSLELVRDLKSEKLIFLVNYIKDRKS